jgi:hyperosmotically inducible periplasmic protein
MHKERLMTKQTVTTMSAVSVLLASLALAGCDKRDETQTARTGDTAVVQGQPTAGEQAKQGADQVADASKQAAYDVANATKNAADQASNKVSDAVITTSVNAELAKDPQLSSLRIDVDTDAGRVALKGSAPDAAAKQRATQLASSVKGVVSVDNQLQVGKG